MLSRLRSLILGAVPQAAPTGEERIRLAAAVLLVEAASTDGRFEGVERALITRLVRERFRMAEAEAERLIAAAQADVEHTTQLYGYVKEIKDGLDEAERVQVIEMLWEVAYADGQLHDYEASLIRRICGLIAVSDRDSGEARKRVLARLQ